MSQKEKLQEERKKLNFLIEILKKAYKEISKDIEISKRQFYILLLLFLCCELLIGSNIFLIVIDTTGIKWTNLLVLFSFGGGFMLGLIGGGVLIDKLRGKKYNAIFLTLILSIVINLLQMLLFRKIPIIIEILIFLSSFIGGIMFIIFVMFFLDFTTILERGRTIAFLLIYSSVGIGVFCFFLALSDALLVFPSLAISVFFIYLYKFREKEEPYKFIEEKVNKGKLIKDIITYIVLISFLFFTAGLIFPYEEISNLSIADFSTLELIGALILVIGLSVVTTIAVGAIFDFLGRKSSLSYVILIISIANFISLFNITLKYFNIVVTLIALLAIIMAIPLVMNEVALKQHLGRVIGCCFCACIGCFFGGYSLHWLILRNSVGTLFPDEISAGLFLVGLAFFFLVISMFFLSNTKEIISIREQNWPDKLLRLYVIHESGMLLYEYVFNEVEKELVDSDLVSGGFIGLISMLEEITKEQQRLKIIDHGGKKILFGYSSNKSFICALVLLEDLRVVRHKLDYFIQDIETTYQIGKELGGVDVLKWRNRIDPILDRHFKRKYLDLIPEYFSIKLK
ncbi:MAG: MFS transporter [Candidatus Lokiarchaeota archaeon]|nr:MFS transporter [Candidatus Lokiarchaeota archaeon]